MPRYRMGSTFYTPSTFPMPMPSVPSIVEQSEEIPVEPPQIPTEPCPIPEECIQILKIISQKNERKILKNINKFNFLKLTKKLYIGCKLNSKFFIIINY